MAEIKRKLNTIESLTYVEKSEDEAYLEQLIKQAESRSENEQ
jgi:hypothetical protein